MKFSILRFKPWAESAQALVTIVAFIVGGIWTYRLFVIQREVHAHAIVGVSLARVALTDKVNLVQVLVKIDNTGHELMSLKSATVWVQQVLPLEGCPGSGECVTDELNAALNATARAHDRFAWPIIQRRDASWMPPHRIEPGESDLSDFEFALPAAAQVVRIYGYIPNDSESRRPADETGWHVAKLVDLRKPIDSAEKP